MSKRLEDRMLKIEKTLEVIQNNHLKHIQTDMALIKTVMLLTAAGVVAQLAYIVLRVI